jgi:hypothetical protein
MMEVTQTNIDEWKGNKPAFTARRGRLTLTIWANETEQGTRFSSEITRSWKEGEGYRTTSRLDERDLLASARLAVLADDWIADRRQSA